MVTWQEERDGAGGDVLGMAHVHHFPPLVVGQFPPAGERSGVGRQGAGDRWQVIRWPGGQVARWLGGQVSRWPGGHLAGGER